MGLDNFNSKDKKTKKPPNKKVLVIIGIVSLIVILGVGGVVYKGISAGEEEEESAPVLSEVSDIGDTGWDNQETQSQGETSQEEPERQPEEEQPQEEEQEQGEPKPKPEPEVVYTNQYIDNNGLIYESKEDFVTVKKKDRVRDKEVIFMLEIEYKETSSELRVPYDVYKSMPNKGVIVANIETIELNGQTFITGIEPLKDYKKYLERPETEG